MDRAVKVVPFQISYLYMPLLTLNLNPIDKYLLGFNRHRKRYDYTTRGTISLDTLKAHFIDDCVTVEKFDNGYVTSIHVADPLPCVCRKSDIFDEGYFYEMNKENMSFSSGKKRKAKTLVIYFDSVGRLISYRFIKSNVIVNKNFYRDKLNIDKVKKCDDIVKEQLVNLKEVSRFFEPYKKFKKKTEMLHCMCAVKNLMTLDNCLMARDMRNNGIGIYVDRLGKNKTYSMYPKRVYEDKYLYLTTYSTAPIIDRGAFLISLFHSYTTSNVRSDREWCERNHSLLVKEANYSKTSCRFESKR